MSLLATVTGGNPTKWPKDQRKIIWSESPMNRRRLSWIPGIVVWVWLLGSIGLAKRYPWLDSVWNIAWMLFLLVVAVSSTVQVFRHRQETGGYVRYRGVPRWIVTLLGGDAGPSRKPGTVHKDDPE
jgi:hypothetical protein